MRPRHAVEASKGTIKNEFFLVPVARGDSIAAREITIQHQSFDYANIGFREYTLSAGTESSLQNRQQKNQWTDSCNAEEI